MRDCIRAANLRSSSVTYVTSPITTFRTMNGAMMGMIQPGILCSPWNHEDHGCFHHEDHEEHEVFKPFHVPLDSSPEATDVERRRAHTLAVLFTRCECAASLCVSGLLCRPASRAETMATARV